MKRDNIIKFAAIFVMILIILSIFYLYYITPKQRDDHPYSSFGGWLMPHEVDIQNKTFKFEVNVTIAKPGLPKLDRDIMEMTMKTVYNNGTSIRYHIKRHLEFMNESDKFSFTYLDEDNDGLMSTGDFIIVNVYIDLSQVQGFAFSFRQKGLDGGLTEYDKSEELP